MGKNNAEMPSFPGLWQNSTGICGAAGIRDRGQIRWGGWGGEAVADSGHSHAIINDGEVAERLNAADSKSVLGSHLTGVRIPPSPLIKLKFE